MLAINTESSEQPVVLAVAGFLKIRNRKWAHIWEHPEKVTPIPSCVVRHRGGPCLPVAGAHGVCFPEPLLCRRDAWTKSAGRADLNNNPQAPKNCRSSWLSVPVHFGTYQPTNRRRTNQAAHIRNRRFRAYLAYRVFAYHCPPRSHDAAGKGIVSDQSRIPKRCIIPAKDASANRSCSAFSRSKVRQCIPFGFRQPFGFRMPGSHPSRSRITSARRANRSLASSR